MVRINNQSEVDSSNRKATLYLELPTGETAIFKFSVTNPHEIDYQIAAVRRKSYKKKHQQFYDNFLYV